MSNNIAVSITADVADLTAKRAIASAELKAFQKDLNDLARTAKDGGMTDALRTQMLSLGDSTAKAKNQVALIDRELRSFGQGGAGINAIGQETRAAAFAMEGLHMGTAGVTRELLVMGREASRGNWGRMAGSATILASRMNLLELALNPVTLAAGALTAALVYMAVQEYEAQRAATQLSEAFALTGRGSNESITAIRAYIEALSRMPGVSRQFAEEAIKFDAANGQVNARLAEAANQLLPLYVRAFGKEGPQALNKMKEALAGLERGSIDQIIEKFQRLNEESLNLGPKETALVEGMLRNRDAIGAVNRIIADLGAQGGGNIKSLNEEIAETENELKKAHTALEDAKRASDQAFDSENAVAYANAIVMAANKVDSLEVRLQSLKKIKITPDQGEDLNSAIENSDRTLLSLRDSATRAKEAVERLHKEMKQRIDADPNDAKANDYFAHQSKYDADLKHQMDPGDNKKPKADKSMVSQWTEQLDAIKGQTENWYADQNALIAKYWQGITASGQGSAKDQLEAHNKLQDALKTLDKEGVDQAIETAKKEAEAAGSNVSQVEAIYGALEAVLQAKHAEGGEEWKRVENEKAEAVKRATEAAAKQQRAADQVQLEDLKTNLSAQAEIRRTQAQSAESQIDEGAKYAGPLGEIQAAQQVSAIQKQLRAQDMADAAATYAAEDRLRQQDITNALATYHVGSTQYQEAVDAKTKADTAYYAEKRVKEAQDVAQQMADNQKIAQAWHSTIDPMVSSVGGQMKGLIEGTETWNQAILRIGEDGLQMVINAIEKMVENWIVGMLTGKAAQQTMALSQIASLSGVAGAAGISSMAAAPFPFDLGAPAFGAAMAADAAAFGSVASFAVGAREIPADMIALIHQGERIIPADDSRDIKEAIRANPPAVRMASAGGYGFGASGGFAGGGSNSVSRSSGGSTQNITLAPKSLDARSFAQWANNPKNVRAAMKAFDRHGRR